MKKLFFLFAFMGLLTSCQETDFKSTAVENPKKATTVSIQNTLDTAVIKIDTEAHKLYIVENNLVVREFKWYNNDEAPATFAIILLVMLVGFILGVFLCYLLD